MPWEKIILTRKELFDLVWSKPVAALLRKYDIKNSELRKILTEMNIPTPEMGHWQRLQYGKPIEIKELPIDFSWQERSYINYQRNPLSINTSPQKTLKESLEKDANLPLKS